MIETNLAQAVNATNESNSAYDTNVKYLLADKQILSRISGEVIKKSQNALIAMLEELVSTKDAEEKKRILAEEYGMVMTTELERRIQIMCNWSESIEERSIRCERLKAIERMIKANITKEQIISMGYTEDEYAEMENSVFANS